MILYKLWEWYVDIFKMLWNWRKPSHSFKTGQAKYAKHTKHVDSASEEAGELQKFYHGRMFFSLHPFINLFSLLLMVFLSLSLPPDPGLLWGAASVYDQLPLTCHKDKNIGFVWNLSSFCNKDLVESRFPEGESWPDKEQSYLNYSIFSVKMMFFFSFSLPKQFNTFFLLLNSLSFSSLTQH